LASESLTDNRQVPDKGTDRTDRADDFFMDEGSPA